MHRRWVSVAFVAGALFAIRPVLAQEASSAQALFDEGRRLMAEGKYEEACPKLAASQRIDPGAGTLMNLATCYERGGKLSSAWVTFKEAASAARSSGHADWEKVARERASTLEPKLPRFTITVPPDSDLAGLVVLRDGRPVERAEWGTAVPVDAGTHTLEATAPSRRRWSTSVVIPGAAATTSASIPVLAAEKTAGASEPSPPSGAPSSEPPSSGGTQRLLALASTGAGVVGLSVGAVFGLMARSTHDDALTHCKPSLLCDPEGIRLGDKASNQAAVSTVASIAGGVLVATGAVLFFTAPSGKAHATALWVAPSLGARGGAAALGGSF